MVFYHSDSWILTHIYIKAIWKWYFEKVYLKLLAYLIGKCFRRIFLFWLAYPMGNYSKWFDGKWFQAASWFTCPVINYSRMVYQTRKSLIGPIFYTGQRVNIVLYIISRFSSHYFQWSGLLLCIIVGNLFPLFWNEKLLIWTRLIFLLLLLFAFLGVAFLFVGSSRTIIIVI